MSKPDKTLDRFWDMPQRDLLTCSKQLQPG